MLVGGDDVPVTTTAAPRTRSGRESVRPDLPAALRHGVLSSLGSLARTAALIYAVVLFIWAATGRSTGGADATAASRAAFTTWLTMYGAHPSFADLTITIPPLGLGAIGMWSTYRAARRGITDLASSRDASQLNVHPGAIVLFLLTVIATQASVIGAAAAWASALMHNVMPLQACGAAAACAALMMWLLAGNQDVSDALYVQWRRRTALVFAIVRRFAYAYLVVGATVYVLLWALNLSAVQAVTQPVVSDGLSHVAMAVVNLVFAPTALAWVLLGLSGGVITAGSASIGLLSGVTVQWPPLAAFAVLPTTMNPYAIALVLLPMAVAAYAAFTNVEESDLRSWWQILRAAAVSALCIGLAAAAVAYATAGGILGAADGAWDVLGADLMSACYLAAEVFVGVVGGLWFAARGSGLGDRQRSRRGTTGVRRMFRRDEPQ